MKPIMFRTFDYATFAMNYDEAAEALEEQEVPETLPRQFGDIKVPGYGWMACVRGPDGKPSYFYDDDDGWQPVPKATYKRV